MNQLRTVSHSLWLLLFTLLLTACSGSGSIGGADRAFASLSGLTLSSGTLTPAFQAATTSYTVTVPLAVGSISVTPMAAAGTTITVNGTAVPSGTASAPLALAEGSNVITIVASASGARSRTYTVTVTREPAPAFGGLWSGILSVDDGQPAEVIMISTDDGRFQMLVIDEGIQISGVAELEGAEFSGSGLAYATEPGDTFPDDTAVTGFSFTGTVQSRDSLTADWEIEAGQSGGIVLDYDPAHEQDASFDLVSGTWIVYDDFDNPVITFDIDATGAIFGQGAVCTSAGQIGIPDAQFNVYEWNVEVSGPVCPITGEYSGLGALGQLDDPNDVFLVLASNPQRSLLLPLERP